MKDNLFYIAHPVGQLRGLNLRADLGMIEEKLEVLRNAIENLGPDERSAALNRLYREIDCMLMVIQRTHKKVDRGFVRVLDEDGSGNGS